MSFYIGGLCQDDPMSALDVHVGSHIFREAIARYLLQEEKTVILVTHQLQYMPYAHKVRALDVDIRDFIIPRR